MDTVEATDKVMGDARDTELGDLKREYQELKEGYMRLRNQLTEADNDKQELEKAMEEKQEMCDKLQQEIVTLNEVNRETVTNQKAVLQEASELKAQRQMCEDRLGDLRKQLDKAHKFDLSLDSLKNSDEKVKFYTGLQSYKMFETVLNFLCDHVKESSKNVLAPWQSVLLTLMRLRLSLTLQDLAFRFGISVSTACRTFERWLYAMYVCLDPLIIWPDRETLYLTMAHSFKEAFGNSVAVIVDCFEVFIDRPGSLDSRAMTWSNYKHHNTVKFLIGITPLGAVSFISNDWGGRVSDKYLTANSGLYDKLLPNDVVMADRGFLISKDLGFYCAKLLCPAFTKGRSQLSAYDIADTRKIASLRIHVERVIGLIRRKYSILHSTLPVEFLTKKPGHDVSQIDEIVRVCCALCNLSTGIV